MNNLKALLTSDKDYWETPQELFDELNDEFHFNLDPCSTDANAKCDRHYTIVDNGLEKSWGGAECSAIHLMVVECMSGLRKQTMRFIMDVNW